MLEIQTVRIRLSATNTELLTDMLRVFDTSAHFGRVIGAGEAIFCASQGSSSREKDLVKLADVGLQKGAGITEGHTLGRKDGCSSITELFRNF